MKLFELIIISIYYSGAYIIDYQFITKGKRKKSGTFWTVVFKPALYDGIFEINCR